MSLLRKCVDCKGYTFKEKCMKCGGETREASYKFVKIRDVQKSRFRKR